MLHMPTDYDIVLASASNFSSTLAATVLCCSILVINPLPGMILVIPVMRPCKPMQFFHSWSSRVFKPHAYNLILTRLTGWNPEMKLLPWLCHQQEYGKTEQDDLLQHSRFFGLHPFWRFGLSQQLAVLISSRTHKAKNVDMKDKRDWKPTTRLCNQHGNCDNTLVIFSPFLLPRILLSK
jgi:hypothetical protein